MPHSRPSRPAASGAMSPPAPPRTVPALPVRTGRRALCLAALGGLGPAGAALAQAPEATTGGTILVPGPEDGDCARWAGRAASALGRGLGKPAALRLTFLGGPDGVTAANRFATLDGVEGSRLLVLPGTAFHVLLTGATRARFEPRAWLPLMATWHRAVLAGRGPLPDRNGPARRVAVPTPDAPEAAALALLDHLGLPARAVPGTPEVAYAANEADALILVGPDPLAAARSLGATPWYHLGAPGEVESAEVPPLPSEGPAARGILAAVAGLQMRAALVLPNLTPSDAVAALRRATLRWAEEERGRPSDTPVPSALTGPATAAAYARLLPAPDATLAYRAWLESRLGWRAG